MRVSPHSQTSSRTFDSTVLEQLACPVCFDALRLLLLDAEIACAGCGRVYPLIDGIPVLIPGRAK